MTLQTCTPKSSAHVEGGHAEGLACADPGARTPIGVSGITYIVAGIRPTHLISIPGQPLAGSVSSQTNKT